MHHKIDLTRLQEFFQHVTALEALEILCNIFEAPNSRVFVDGLYFSLKELLTLPKYWANIAADELEIQFYGGPPGKGRHFNGIYYPAWFNECK